MTNEEYHKHDETNRLIAEFMQLKNDGHGMYYFPEYSSGEWHTVYELRHHESWDWLMPVIERIQKEGFKTSIENNWTSIDGCTDETDGIWFETTGANLNMLQATYEAVVKFIKWYNDNKRHEKVRNTSNQNR